MKFVIQGFFQQKLSLSWEGYAWLVNSHYQDLYISFTLAMRICSSIRHPWVVAGIFIFSTPCQCVGIVWVILPVLSKLPPHGWFYSPQINFVWFWFSVLTLFQLLRRNPERRLGASEKDAEDVRKQPFFRVRKIFIGLSYISNSYAWRKGENGNKLSIWSMKKHSKVWSVWKGFSRVGAQWTGSFKKGTGFYNVMYWTVKPCWDNNHIPLRRLLS